jgi:hypothetical protein
VSQASFRTARLFSSPSAAASAPADAATGLPRASRASGLGSQLGGSLLRLQDPRGRLVMVLAGFGHRCSAIRASLQGGERGYYGEPSAARENARHGRTSATIAKVSSTLERLASAFLARCGGPNRRLEVDLVRPAILRRLVGVPADQPGAMPELAAADVVGAEFGDEPGLQPDHLLCLAGPPALAAR